MIIEKRVVDFLSVLIELYSPVLLLRRYERISVHKLAILLQRWPVDPKFQIEGVAPPTILLLRKLC